MSEREVAPGEAPDPRSAVTYAPRTRASTSAPTQTPWHRGSGPPEGEAGATRPILGALIAFAPLLGYLVAEVCVYSLVPPGRTQAILGHGLPPLVMLGVACAIWRLVPPLPVRRAASRGHHGLAVAGGLLLGAVAALANLMSMLARIEGGRGILDPEATALLLHVALLAPLAEEAAFRGLIYRHLRRSLTPAVAAWISAVIFALMHPQLSQGVWALGLGLVTAVAYEQTASLVAPVLVHALFNAVPVGVAVARARPDDLGPIWLVVGAMSLVFTFAARSAARAAAADQRC